MTSPPVHLTDRPRTTNEFTITGIDYDMAQFGILWLYAEGGGRVRIIVEDGKFYLRTYDAAVEVVTA